MTLKDCSVYNVQFQRGRPIFIDTLSFEKYHEGPHGSAIASSASISSHRWPDEPEGSPAEPAHSHEYRRHSVWTWRFDFCRSARGSVGDC